MFGGTSRGLQPWYWVVSNTFPSGRSRSSCERCWTRSWSKIGASTCTTTSHFLDLLIRSSKECQPISICVAKVELVGPFKNGGRTWRPKGRPQEVTTKDFPSLAQGKALPYGVYDTGQNRAVVNVGVTHDTAEFAVESIRRWWKMDGRRSYPAAGQLLICADAGGSNGNRLRAWKLHLQQMADQIQMPITVCHYPPGTSKWNKIEHRLFSFISLNWRGQPLINYETIINLIGGTKTRTGLKVQAVLDTNEYETGIKVSDEQLGEIQLRRHKVHPAWNYTISPRESA